MSQSYSKKLKGGLFGGTQGTRHVSAKNHKNYFIFDRVIKKIKRCTFFGTQVCNMHREMDN